MKVHVWVLVLTIEVTGLGYRAGVVASGVVQAVQGGAPRRKVS